MKSLLPFPIAVPIIAFLVFPLVLLADLPAPLDFEEGPINSITISREGRKLAINSSTSSEVDTLLLTHARRDIVETAREMTSDSTYAPVSSRDMLEGTSHFWETFWTDRFDYYKQQVTRIPTRDFPADQYLEDGETIPWQGITIHFVSTPGYTRDGGTYIVELEGKTLAFTGDLILAGGKVPDIYSFQDEIREAKVGGYHGYMGRLSRWLNSLEKLSSLEIDYLVPSRGPISEKPEQDIEMAKSTARAIYQNYLSTNALHWYFGEERMNTCAELVLGPDQKTSGMPFAEHIELPDWCQHIGTTKLLVSQSGKGFALDVGGPRSLETLKQAQSDGLITELSGIFATHAHNDHTQQIAEAAAHFHCPVYAVDEVADVLRHPGRWFLPGVSANAVPDTVTAEDGQTMEWEEFQFTFHFFPGQMHNHGALLVATEGHAPVFFIGDSFSPSGIDDYCLMNRNLMRKDMGYHLCFAKVRGEAADTWLVNQHIPHLFRFSPEELAFLESSYRKREALIDSFTPWDDRNYAIDEQWASFYPYGQTVKAGESTELEVRIWNHSTENHKYTVEAHGIATGTAEIELGPRETGAASVSVAIPTDAPSGIEVITATIKRDDGVECRHWCEALLLIE